MSWAIYLDRRRSSYDVIAEELFNLRDSVAGVSLKIADSESFEHQPDEGKFRDFVFVAHLSHPEQEVMNWLAEELVDQLGWAIDIRVGLDSSPNTSQE